MIEWVTRICATLSGIALLIMAFIGVSDIVGIHLFGQPVPGVVELTSSLMVISIFFGLPITEARGKNVRVEILIDRAPASVQRILGVISRLTMVALFGLIAWFGWQSFVRSVVTNEFAQGLIEVPYWPSRLALVIGAVLVAVQALLAGIRELRSGRLEQDAETTWKV
ncbi:MAG: TRAP transporter small permease [Alphaproteobacteria bacterium]|nr:TRAP transporter small permease [Alphaproteobacteria bacterium]